jgi:lambda family phage portal protein
MAVATVRRPLLLDAYGRPARRAQPYYTAAGGGRRFHNLLGSNASASAVILANAESLRARSHDLHRNNPWALNAQESFVANSVGTGIRPKSLAPDRAWRSELHELWNDWTDEADADDLTTFYGLQALNVAAIVESGECFTRLRLRRPEDGLAVPLQLQVLEPDHVLLSTTRTASEGNVIRGGIEFNPIGQRVAYWMTRAHPGDSALGFLVNGLEEVRVPADSVAHVYVRRRPGGIRGGPWMASVLMRLNELDQFDDAELVRKKTAALFAGFVTTPTGDTPELLGAETTIAGASDALREAILEPGTMQYLEPGEDVKFAEPADVGSTFEAFVRHELRGIAAGLNITYEQLTGDLTGVNFSSIRAGLIEFRRRLQGFIAHTMCHQFCRRVWRAFVREAILSGAISMPPDFATNPRPWYRVRWVHQGWEYVDPLKEIAAQRMAIRAGIMTRSEAITMRGKDPEQLDEEFNEEQERANSYGLMFDSDPRHDAGPADTAAVDELLKGTSDAE